MQMFRVPLLVLAILFGPLPAKAVGIDYAFSFVNVANGSGAAEVTGVIRGLTNNRISAAQSFEVLTNGDGFGIGEYIGNPSANLFSVVDGRILTYFFTSFGSENAGTGAVTDASISLEFRPPATNRNAGLTPFPGQVLTSPMTDLEFKRISPVPVPAALPLFATLLTGFGALAWARRRKVPSR